MTGVTPDDVDAPLPPYRIEDQFGFMLRQATQRHTALFASRFGTLTTTQWAVLSKLAEVGPTSQNRLGRLTAMDVATINGVVERLGKKGLVTSTIDVQDARRHLLDVTAEGRALVDKMIAAGRAIARETLAPLTPEEAAILTALLRKLA